MRKCHVNTVPTGGTTYYVDSTGGNDANNGTAPERAWRSVRKVSGRCYAPGDKILLKAGSVWNGEQLCPKGSGAAHAPLVIDQYGAGPKPVIHANAAHEAAVQLVNQEYWEINNLEITNARDLARPADVGNHVGILLMIENESQVFRHVYIANCHIHDVDGDPNFQGADDKTTGGICGRVRAEKGRSPGHFEDVRIENNRIERVSRSGIFLFSSRDIYSTSREPKDFVRDFFTYLRPADDWHEEFYSRDLYIAGNTIDRAAGDGIVVTFTRGALVEHNTVTRSSDRSSAACAGMWPCYASHVVFQYNEVAHITNAKDDGTAFDFDCGSRDVIYQYNYSHHNKGGWMLLMKNAPDANLVARHNVSAFESMGKTWDTPDNSVMHNNVFYQVECVRPEHCSSELIGFKSAYNNLFIECRNIGFWRKNNDGVHDHNAYINSGGNQGEAQAMTGDPQLLLSSLAIAAILGLVGPSYKRAGMGGCNQRSEIIYPLSLPNLAEDSPWLGDLCRRV